MSLRQFEQFEEQLRHADWLDVIYWPILHPHVVPASERPLTQVKQMFGAVHVAQGGEHIKQLLLLESRYRPYLQSHVPADKTRDLEEGQLVHWLIKGPLHARQVGSQIKVHWVRLVELT